MRGGEREYHMSFRIGKSEKEGERGGDLGERATDGMVMGEEEEGGRERRKLGGR
jgi:hypothetical protein